MAERERRFDEPAHCCCLRQPRRRAQRSRVTCRYLLAEVPCRGSMSWRRVSKAMRLAIDKVVTASKLGSHDREST